MRPEKEGKVAVEREISSLKTQVEALTEKCHKLQLDLEVTKAERKNVQVRHGHFCFIQLPNLAPDLAVPQSIVNILTFGGTLLFYIKV